MEDLYTILFLLYIFENFYNKKEKKFIIKIEENISFCQLEETFGSQRILIKGDVHKLYVTYG